MKGPAFWMHEIPGGPVRPAVTAYLHGCTLSRRQVELIRLYLVQWINAPVWKGDVARLCELADKITCQAEIDYWLIEAEKEGIDPL